MFIYYINIRRYRLWRGYRYRLWQTYRWFTFIHTQAMSGWGMAPRKIICMSPCQRFSALPPLVHSFNFEKMLCENYKYEKRYRSRCPKKKEQRYSRRWPNTHTHKHTFTGKHTVHFSSMLSLAPAYFTAFKPDISRIEKNIAPTQHAFAKFIPISGMGGKKGTQNKKYMWKTHRSQPRRIVTRWLYFIGKLALYTDYRADWNILVLDWFQKSVLYEIIHFVFGRMGGF